jgi:D-sedoheptulose 7-phosphate isomerase
MPTQNQLSSTAGFQSALDELSAVLTASACLSDTVSETGAAILASLLRGGQLLTCGNGGSAADALHLAEELVGRYRRERRALPAICLAADPTALTCIGNDYGFDRVFSRGVEALGRPGDILVAFSTSGNSPNVLAALQAARARGVISILLSGKDGGQARSLADHSIVVPSANTARIQEVHTLVLHQWLETIDAHPWA